MAAGKGPLSPFAGVGTPLTGGTTEPKLRVPLDRGEALMLRCLGTAMAALTLVSLCYCPVRLCWWSD